ncbi:trypsin iota-like [Chrysoperla carnea]|uniref:trypsin iota-like n=1 Tax=Chrysoperla carnea TaxID=189513 RepID=UPI001D05F64D|nr:trypsin iota-like [Chrysoperla carnea]
MLLHIYLISFVVFILAVVTSQEANDVEEFWKPSSAKNWENLSKEDSRTPFVGDLRRLSMKDKESLSEEYWPSYEEDRKSSYEEDRKSSFEEYDEPSSDEITTSIPPQGSNEHDPNHEPIFNRNPGSLEEVPYIVSIRDVYQNHTCNGILISKFWVLTAAHCLDKSNYPLQTIQYGVEDISGGENIDLASENIEFIIQQFQYRNYKKYSNKRKQNVLLNDIALLRLAGPANIKEFAKLANPMEPTPENGDASLFGFISTEEGIQSTKLLESNLNIIDLKDCEKKFKGHWLNPLLSKPDHICASADKAPEQCKDDSGSPLIINGKVFGIASGSVYFHGNEPCSVETPGIYTRIATFRPWIKQLSGV